MQSLSDVLGSLFGEAFETCGLDRQFGEVVVSQRPDLSQFQCNGALAAARVHRKDPREVARSVIDALKEKANFSNLSLAGPGFINISLTDEFLARHIQEMAQDERLLCSPVVNPKRVIIDFGGPNIAKSMHVGHLRSSIIGDSLQRLFRFMGDTVISDIHLGDWGTQIGMLIRELRRQQPDAVYFDESYTGPYPETHPVTISDLEAMYPMAFARCRSDQQEMRSALQATVELQQKRPGYMALWKHFHDVSSQMIKRDFDRLGVKFDLWFGESRYHDRIGRIIEELKTAGHAQLSDGALIVPVADEADEKPVPPLILVKSDGGYLYGTTDLATIEERVHELHAEQILYVVDKRQSLHFEQVFRAARLTGIAGDTELEHIAFGTVNGPDGRPFKTRQGGVTKLQDLISMATEEGLKRMSEIGVAESYSKDERLDIARKVGLAALKFADLIHHRTSDYVFDIEKFTAFEGRTGPYLLYATVRIRSILRKAAQYGFATGPILPPKGADRDLILELSRFPEAVDNAYINREPNRMCEHAYDLAQAFSRFYQSCHVISEEDAGRRASWLTLAQLCLRQLELTMDLLGIEAPQRM